MSRQVLDLPLREVRFAVDESEGIIEGHAAIFGELVPYHNERVERGAFTKTLAEHLAAGTRPAMLWSHGDDVIGVWESVTEDERGLKVRGRIIRETQRGAEAFALIKAKAVDGFSIGFFARDSVRDKSGVRVIRDVDLIEISITPTPASRKARITQVRSDGSHAAAAFIEAVKAATRALSPKGT
jgi:uncharacterized protein